MFYPIENTSRRINLDKQGENKMPYIDNTINKINSIPFKDFWDYFPKYETHKWNFSDNFNTKERKIPDMNVYTSEEKTVYEIALPGCTKEKVSVSVEGNKMYIIAETSLKGNSNEYETGCTNIITKYNFCLQKEYMIEVTKASLENGILTLEIKKKDNYSQTIKIT